MIFAWVKYEEPKIYSYVYPRWAIGLSLFLALLPFVVTAMGFLIRILGQSEGIKEV